MTGNSVLHLTSSRARHLRRQETSRRELRGDATTHVLAGPTCAYKKLLVYRWPDCQEMSGQRKMFWKFLDFAKFRAFSCCP